MRKDERAATRRGKAATLTNYSGRERRDRPYPPRLPQPALPALLTRPPARLLHNRRQVRAAQHVVERGQIAGQRVTELRLRSLESILQVLVHGELLVRRLEVGACQAVRQV